MGEEGIWSDARRVFRLRATAKSISHLAKGRVKEFPVKHLARHLSVVAIVTIVATLVLAVPASAGRGWCRADPIVTVDGTPVQIWVAIPEEWEPYVNDKIKVKIKAPKHLDREVIFLDEGFNGHGEEVKWGDVKDENPEDDVIPLEIEVKLKFDTKRMEKDFGKAQLEEMLGKDKLVPIQVEVNVGDDVETVDTYVEYGHHKKTKFTVAIMVGTEASD
jgi:hypothetical protein